MNALLRGLETLGGLIFAGLALFVLWFTFERVFLPLLRGLLRLLKSLAKWLARLLRQAGRLLAWLALVGLFVLGGAAVAAFIRRLGGWDYPLLWLAFGGLAGLLVCCGAALVDALRG